MATKAEVQSAISEVEETERKIVQMIKDLENKYPFFTKVYASDGGRAIHFKIATHIDQRQIKN